MKKYNNSIIIGIDHGYGNIKTANTCFPTGVNSFDTEPIFKDNMLIWNNKYHLIGNDHKEFIPDKIFDDDYYILTLAGIAKELNINKIYFADIYLSAGLPLTWVSEQKERFKKYLLQNKQVNFTFKGKPYFINFIDVDIYPQGFAAIINNISEFTGLNMLCDIGNGTMNIMFVTDKKPDAQRIYTEKFGTHQCTLQIRENIMRKYHTEIPEQIINTVLRFGTADIDRDYLQTITQTAKQYVFNIFRKLREHGYDEKLMKLHVVGGGSHLIKNFADIKSDRVIINEDICATAKGYERMLEMKLIRGGGKL